LFAALCQIPFAKAQTSGGAVLTLEEALQLARSNNRDLKVSGLDVGKQRETLSEAKTHLYPRFDTSVLEAQLLAPLDFTIKKGQLGSFSATGPIPGSNTDLHTPARPIAIASVTATQPLTQLIRIHLFVAEQQLIVDASQLSLSEREQKLIDDVRQSYYQVLQSQIQYESQQSVVKYLEELLQLTDRRFSQHAALEADRLGVKAEVAKATYQLTTTEKSHYIPDIAIQASYFTPANINFLPQNIGAVGALLTWQPWDWGEKRHKVQQAALAEKQAGLSADDSREQILLEVDSNFRRLREARAHLAVTEAIRD